MRSRLPAAPASLRFTNDFTRPKAPQRIRRHDGSVIELPDIFAVALMLLTVVLFAAMIWAGNHQH
jgi:hypothetical protein